MITKEEILKVKEKLSSCNDSYFTNEAYVRGKNPDILQRDNVKDPDNRIPVPLAKMAVEDLTGYAARPGDITIRYDNVMDENADSQEDDYNEIVRKWMSENNDKIELSELYQKMLTHGKSYELWWVVNAETTAVAPQWKRIDGNKVYIQYSMDLKPVKEKAYYFRMIEDTEICDIYMPLMSERWEKVKDGEWTRDITQDTTYPYTTVPVIEYTGNMDKLPLFEAEKPLIDAIDTLLSNSVNEIDRFNALIALFPGKIDKEFKDKLRSMKVIDDLAQWEHWPEYLEKNLGGVTDFYNQLADRLERLYHKSIKIPDMTDEAFAGNQSGIAIAYKLIGMEFKASMIETYFFKGIYDRKQLLDDIFKNGSTSSIDTEQYKTVIDAKRNIPIDEKSKVEIAMLLKGLVSDETLLRFLPNTIVNDIEKELLKMEEQKLSNPLLDDEETTTE